MIRFLIKERIADKEFETGRRITIEEICKATGISRPTMSRLINTKGYTASTDIVDKLGAYFDVPVEKIIVRIPDEE